jgi:hypothetical protein
MANPFGDQDASPGGAAKRPAQTIEATATEVSVEPSADDTPPAGSEAHAEADKDQAPLGRGEEKAETMEEQAAPPPPPRTSMPELKSFVTHLAAGMLGALVAVVALAFLWDRLPLGSPAAPDLSKLEDRIAKLESALSSSDDSKALADLDARVKALETRPSETPPELAALSNRVTELETALKAMAEAAKDGGPVADAAAISQQMSEIEQKLQARIDAALAEAEAANESALKEMQVELAELKAKFAALAEAELGGAGSADLQPEITALADRIAKLEAALPDLSSAINKEASDTKSATLAIAFANLRAQISEGRPYAAELDTLGALSPEAGDLGILPAYAEKGIPTLAELTHSFEATKDAALAAAAPAAEGSMLDSLLASALSLVKVRRVDEAATGNEPSAVLARAEGQLDGGNLAAAVKEVETLKGAPRAQFSDWLDQAHARLSADDLVQRLESILLVSVGAATPPSGQQDEQEQE